MAFIKLSLLNYAKYQIKLINSIKQSIFIKYKLKYTFPDKFIYGAESNTV